MIVKLSLFVSERHTYDSKTFIVCEWVYAGIGWFVNISCHLTSAGKLVTYLKLFGQAKFYILGTFSNTFHLDRPQMEFNSMTKDLWKF
jgi:hypothetical protein